MPEISHIEPLAPWVVLTSTATMRAGARTPPLPFPASRMIQARGASCWGVRRARRTSSKVKGGAQRHGILRREHPRAMNGFPALLLHATRRGRFFRYAVETSTRSRRKLPVFACARHHLWRTVAAWTMQARGISSYLVDKYGVPNGDRTRVPALKGLAIRP